MDKVQFQKFEKQKSSYKFLKPANPAGFKRRFVLAGAANIFLTNLLLQLLLFSNFFSLGACTFASQLFNGLIGYMIYGKFVFAAQGMRTLSLPGRYLALMMSLWWLNWIGIGLLQLIHISKNVGGILMIVPLAAYSYVLQRKWVFKA